MVATFVCNLDSHRVSTVMETLRGDGIAESRSITKNCAASYGKFDPKGINPISQNSTVR